MNASDRAWASTLGLIAIHQTEEVLVSCEEWHERVGTSRMAWLDRHLDGNWMAAKDPRKRVAAQTAQTTALIAAYLATRRHPRATRVATTGLTLAWSAAFWMHLTASIKTRTIMPGTSTSVVPGWIGAAVVLRQIWHPDNGD